MTTADSPAEPTVNSDLPKTEATPPLRAVHTPNFPALLRQFGASLLVTTYRAGKLVMVRDEGDHLNTQLTKPERRLQHGLAVQLAPETRKRPRSASAETSSRPRSTKRRLSSSRSRLR
jgi:hypothetical protein